MEIFFMLGIMPILVVLMFFLALAFSENRMLTKAFLVSLVLGSLAEILFFIVAIVLVIKEVVNG